jgi:hypothetical protein
LKGFQTIVLQFGGKGFAYSNNASKGEGHPNDSGDKLARGILVHGKTEAEDQYDDEREKQH